MSICRGFGCLRGEERGGGGRGKRRKMKEEEEKEKEKRRREGDEDVKSFPLFFLLFLLFLSLIIISPLTKCLFFPIQQYPSSMKNSPDPVWYSTP